MGEQNTHKSSKDTSRNGKYRDIRVFKKTVLILTIFTDTTGPVTTTLQKNILKNKTAMRLQNYIIQKTVKYTLCLYKQD